MPSDDSDGERAENGVETVDFGTIEDEELPEWATGEASVPAGGSVGWSRTRADYSDTAGTSIDPDLDDVDPGDLLDEVDDGEFPRPGADADGSIVTNPPLVPTDPTVALGLGAALPVAVGGCYLLLAAVVGGWPAVAVVLAAVFIVGFLAVAGDLFDRRP